MAVARSRVRQFPAVSPTGLAESSSLSLRTGYSPQDCSPPFLTETQLPLWIQGDNVTLEGTCTLLFKRLRRRTRAIVLNRFTASSIASQLSSIASQFSEHNAD